MGVLVEAPRTLAFTDCDRTLIADTSTWLLSLEAKRRAASREIHVDKSAEDLLPKALAAGEIPSATLAAHKAASEEIAGKKELFNAFVAMLRRPLEQVRLLPAASGPQDGATAAGTQLDLSKCPQRKLLCGIDDADRLGGVTLKLLALEQLLRRVPRWRDRVALLQVVAHSSSDGSAAHAKAIEARAIARRINA